MDDRIRKIYEPMTETAFYILLCLKEPNHGYGITSMVETMTNGAIRIAPGTMYGTLAKMEKDRLIRLYKEENKRRIYIMTSLGSTILDTEIKRIERLYKNSKGEKV